MAYGASIIVGENYNIRFFDALPLPTTGLQAGQIAFVASTLSFYVVVPDASLPGFPLSWTPMRSAFLGTPSTNLQLFGGISMGVTTLGDGDYVVVDGDYHAEFNILLTAPRSVTLPSAAALPGRVIVVSSYGAVNGANVLNIAAAAGNIDGAASVQIATAYGSRTFQSDGTNWKSIASV